MSTVSEVIAVLERIAPPSLAESWDNVGLLVGRRDAEVRNVLSCLTLTADVAREAVEDCVQLVVSHHPVMFRGVKSITDVTDEGRILLSLIENGVAVYSPHTCFDSAALGVNQQLATAFGLKNILPLRPIDETAVIGSGRVGELNEPVPLSDFLGGVKSAVNAQYLEFCGSGDANVRHVAVACGAAAEFLSDAVALGCDTFVTGEARFHSALEATAAGLNMILLGHYSSERPAVEALAELIAAELPDTDVFASRAEHDPLGVFR